MVALSDFTIETQVGKGSFARVYRVTKNSDRKRYALKEVNLRQMTQREREDAVNEVRLLASIKHDRVIHYYDTFIENDRMYIVMEYAKHGDLYMKLKKHKEKKAFLDEAVILDIFAQVCEGLATLHNLGVVHRDIKSPNVFLVGNGNVKLGDLGIATLLKGKHATSRIGTPYYMSPEVWRAQPYNQKSDMWALGCLLYEMASLKHPFDAKDEKMLGRRVVRGYYQPPPRGYSKELVRTIKLLLNVNPEKRLDIIDLLNSPFLRRRMGEEDGLWHEDDFALGAPSLLSTIKVPRDISKLIAHLPEPRYCEERVSIRPSLSRSVPTTKNEEEGGPGSLPAIAPRTAQTDPVNPPSTAVSLETNVSVSFNPSPPAVKHSTEKRSSRPSVVRQPNPTTTSVRDAEGQSEAAKSSAGGQAVRDEKSERASYVASRSRPPLQRDIGANKSEKARPGAATQQRSAGGPKGTRTGATDQDPSLRSKETGTATESTRLPRLENIQINSLKRRALDIVSSTSSDLPIEVRNRFGDVSFDPPERKTPLQHHVYASKLQRKVWINHPPKERRKKGTGAHKHESIDEETREKSAGDQHCKSIAANDVRLSNLSKAVTDSRGSDGSGAAPLSLPRKFPESANVVEEAVDKRVETARCSTASSSTASVGSPPVTPPFSSMSGRSLRKEAFVA